MTDHGENAALRDRIGKALYEWAIPPDPRGGKDYSPWSVGRADRDEIMQRPYLDQADAVVGEFAAAWASKCDELARETATVAALRDGESVAWLRSWWANRKERRNRPVPECPHCGHPWMMGLSHDTTACELKRLRREVEALRAEVAADPRRIARGDES